MNTTSSVTTSEWLRIATSRLHEAGCSSSQLDALILLEDQTGKDRSWLLAHPETTLSTQEHNTLERQLAQRLRLVPLAYIRGKIEFYGREFRLDNSVLIPRPESETIIDMVKLLGNHAPPTIIDVGTGSGSLAITAKLELPQTEVIGIDIDKQCLAVARVNTKRLGADVRFLRGDLLAPLAENELTDTMLLCNLPYVPQDFHINRDASYEPSQAIFGGSDGLDHYRHLFEHLSRVSTTPTYILTESMPFQHRHLRTITDGSGYSLLKTEGFIQLFKPR